MSSYANISRATQTGLEPGYKDTVYFALVEDMLTWQSPTNTPTNPGDKYKITTQHVLETGKLLYSIECKLYSPVATSEEVGDPGEKNDKQVLIFEVLGDNAPSYEMFKAMQNQAMVFWTKDADCKTNLGYIQYGDDCVPASFGFAFNSRKSNEDGKKIYTCTVNAKPKYFYTAALPVSPGA